MSWKFVNIVMDGQAIRIDSINPWDYEWILLAEDPIEVPHPGYPNQMHKMWRYKIVTDKKEVVFAAGEFSNCVWGFYVPHDTSLLVTSALSRRCALRTFTT